jgi:hypothetical protein
MALGRIYQVTFEDPTLREYGDRLTTVHVGDTYGGQPVEEILVDTPLDLMPSITFLHKSNKSEGSATVLPGVRIANYRAEWTR